VCVFGCVYMKVKKSEEFGNLKSKVLRRFHTFFGGFSFLSFLVLEESYLSSMK